ncbi:MAG TPA: hypothetical protein VGH73_03110 [Thermoanaerobaculia bacterium]|jgi:hypothetical protein
MRPGRPLSLPLLPLLAFLLIAGAASAQTTPSFSFEDSAVVAGGMTPGGSVIWFGVEYQVDASFSTDVFQHFDAGTAAADGTARLDLGRSLVPHAIWVAVDLASGRYAMSGTRGGRLLRADPSSVSSLVPGGGTVSDQIVDHRPYILGLAVRPGVGAWSFGGGDGGSRDLDGASNGSLSFALSQFDPLPGSPAAPAQAGAADLWFVIDPAKMQVSVQKDGVAQP